jgi:subtilase family serine protease
VSHRGAVASFTTAALSALALLGATTAGAASAATVAVQARSQLATPSRLVASTAASADVQFSLGLKLRNKASAVAFAEAVSNPKSSQYRHFLSTAKWERLYSPAQSSVEAATAWLTSEGITVKSVASDRMAINAVGSAAAVEHAFGVSLGEYQREGRQVRLASGSLTVPSYLGSVVSGVTGVNQSLAKPDSITGGGEVGEAQAQEEDEAAPSVKPTAVRSGSPAAETEKEK